LGEEGSEVGDLEGGVAKLEIQEGNTRIEGELAEEGK